MATKDGRKTGGRKKGTPNKINAEFKEMLATAFSNVGGHKYLEQQAEKNPQAFMTLLGKAFVTEKKETELSGDIQIEATCRLVRPK